VDRPTVAPACITPLTPLRLSASGPEGSTFSGEMALDIDLNVEFVFEVCEDVIKLKFNYG
jgi:hypothetical protein